MHGVVVDLDRGLLIAQTKMSPTGVRVSPAGLGAITFLVVLILYYLVSRFGSQVTVEDGEVSLRALLIAGIDFAERGGDQVREVRLSSDLKEESKGKTKEGANDPMTMGDKLSHQAMSRSFTLNFPDVPLISEESDGKPVAMNIKPAPTENLEVSKIVGDDDKVVEAHEVTIWIDPLDATQEYTENLTEYVTTMVCVAVKGRPIIGVIHKPFTHETFWAWVGHGTNVVKEIVGNEDEHRIIVSRSHAGKVKETAEKAFGDDVTVVPAGGAGFKSLALFNGKASVYLHTTLIKKWDICAGNAILDASGGKMTTLSGSRIDYARSGNPKNEGGLLAALNHHESYLHKLGYA